MGSPSRRLTNEPDSAQPSPTLTKGEALK